MKTNPLELQTFTDDRSFEQETDESAAPYTVMRARSSKPHLSITAVVKGKENTALSWTEHAELTSVSGSGAGFFITRAWPVGRLLSLMMPMPLHLRSYDRDKKLYRIWGLVQHCYEAGGEDKQGFHVGVAFIGKDAPESYIKNPMQSYRIVGAGRDGLWKIDEHETSFMARRYVRYWNAVDSTVFLLDDDLNSVEEEHTVTENVSETGASVFSEMRLGVGDRIKFCCDSPPFSSLAVVRNRRIGVDNRTRLHIEFVEDTFPITGVEAPIEEQGEH
jgi:hypothetical protein